jgi:hypothetical protein
MEKRDILADLEKIDGELVVATRGVRNLKICVGISDKENFDFNLARVVDAMERAIEIGKKLVL